MSLKFQQLSVLGAIELEGNSCIAAIGRRLGMSPKTVRNALVELQARGVESASPVVNPAAFGAQEVSIYAASLLDSYRTEEWRRRLQSISGVAAVARFVGEFGLHISVWSRGYRGAQEAIGVLESALDGRLRTQLTTTTIRRIIFPRWATPSSRAGERASLEYGVEGAELRAVSLDETDVLILAKLLSQNTSIRNLSRECGLPNATVDFRVKRMESRGVIVGWRCRVPTHVLDKVAFRLLVRTPRKISRNEIRTCATAISQIVELSEVLGPWNFEIDVELDSAAELPSVLQKLEEHIAAREIKVLTVVGRDALRPSLVSLSNAA